MFGPLAQPAVSGLSVTPDEFAAELGISSKALRAWLRRRYPRSVADHGQRWLLDSEQVDDARKHFGGPLPSGPSKTSGGVEPAVAPGREAPTAGSSLERRRRAADRYRPSQVRLLLVAEAPPTSEDRYFYFENISEHDSLFRYVAKQLLGATPTRQGKAGLLGRLRDLGVFLIDLSEEPSVGRHANHVPGLIDRCRELRPEHIVLIKTAVYDAAFGALVAAGLPVIDARIPFPGSGNQRRFEVAFDQAVRTANIQPAD